MIVRVQDKMGRGPWKPGFSSVWMTDDTPRTGKTIEQDCYENIADVISTAYRNGMNVGCAMEEEDIGTWFNADDLATLYGLGYEMVDCSDCMVLAEGDTQVLIGYNMPLQYLPRVKL